MKVLALLCITMIVYGGAEKEEGTASMGEGDAVATTTFDWSKCKSEVRTLLRRLTDSSRVTCWLCFTGWEEVLRCLRHLWGPLAVLSGRRHGQLGCELHGLQGHRGGKPPQVLVPERAAFQAAMYQSQIEGELDCHHLQHL